MLKIIFPFLTSEQEEQLFEVFELTENTYFTNALVENIADYIQNEWMYT